MMQNPNEQQQPTNQPATSLPKFLAQKQQQNTFHQYPQEYFAGFWMRMWAYLVDLIAVGCLKTIIIGWFSWFTTIFDQPVIDKISYLIIYLAYFILMTKWNHGQTIGKMIFGLKVVCFSEDQLSWATVLTREGACRFMLQVFILCYLGYLPAAFSKRKSHIGDFFSNTGVVTLNYLKLSSEKTAQPKEEFVHG